MELGYILYALELICNVQRLKGGAKVGASSGNFLIWL